MLVLVAACAAAPAAASADPRALFARERHASGGDAWKNVAAVQSGGIVLLGGSPSRFTQIVDRTTGASKSTTFIGPVTDVAGFDGVTWDYQGSAVTEQTLPGLVMDAVTQAYAARDGWWNRNDPATMSSLGASGSADGARVVPAHGSPIDVWFDRATGLIDRTVAHTDSGPVLTTEDDYRAVGDLVVAFHSVETDPTGTVTATSFIRFTPLRVVAAGAFARPASRSLGRIARGAAQAVVPFRFNRDIGWIYTTVRVGGRPAPLIFDSGGANYFSVAAARSLELKSSGGLPISGVGNGSINAGLAQLGTIALGDAQLVDQHGIVAPLPYVVTHPGAGTDTDGLIGAEFLQNLRIAFDFVANTMTLTPFGGRPTPPAAGVAEPLLSDGAHAYVRASIDGVPGLFLLDTGDAGGITVFRRFANAHGLFRGRGLTYLSAGGVGGHLAYRLYRARSFVLGGGTMHAPPVTVSEASAGAFASRSIAGNIGIRVLSRYRLTFDFNRKAVTFATTPSIAAPFTTDHTGMSLTQNDPSAFIVLSVVPGSPAARAGVAAGDRIVALNTTNVGTARLGLSDAAPFVRGMRPYALTTSAKDGIATVHAIQPRVLLP